MKRTRKRVLLFVVFCAVTLLTAESLSQTRTEMDRLSKGYIPPEQIVSMSFATPLDRAISIFNELSKKFLGKVIFDPEKRTIPIGVDIESMQWRDAFERILRFNGLWYEETADYLRIIALERAGEGKGAEKDERPTLSTREVQISAVFYSIDAARVRESGISWSIFRGNNVNVRVDNNAADFVGTDLFVAEGTPRFDFDVDIHTLMKFFESKSLGELISRPQITVRSGQEGVIQVGTDFPINTRDFAGNLITRIEHAGTIIRVTPEVITEGNTNFIHLKAHVERSSVAPSALGFEKAKTEASTSALLLDGEETVIGGLYSYEEKELREGIPILKDLPWWFLGLRYLFGHNKMDVTRKDLIILIKASLLPPLPDRTITKENLIEKQILENEKDTKFRKREVKEKK
jgi:hypothetical protein